MKDRAYCYSIFTSILQVCLLLFLSTAASANSSPDSIPAVKSKTTHILPWYIHRFNIEAGMFLPSNHTDIKVGLEGRSSATLIDFENDLGFKTTSKIFLGKAQWRVSRRSLLEFKYYNIARSSTYSLKKDIDFADTTFHINASVNSVFNTSIFEFTYGYSIISRPRYELGFKLGVHLVSAKAGLSTNNNLGFSTLTKEFRTVKPLPDFGIWGGYSLNKKWALQASGGYFFTDRGIKKITVAHVTILTYNVLLHYKATEHVNLCAGFMGYYVNMNASFAGLTGYLDWGYHGPTLKASYVFGRMAK